VCYADLEGQVVINYDSKIYKCTARDFKEEYSYGELLQNGEIKWNIPLLSKRLGNSTFENKFCLRCNLLPVCMGPCSQKMVEFPENYDEKFFKKFCLKDGVIEIIKEKLENHYNKINKKSENL
jgi:radical SAM protein with 4Fe4S-binding SPASM domain